MTLEKDPDRDVRDNVFSPFSEKEKTESPSSDDLSEELRSAIETLEAPLPPPVAEVVTPQVEIVETPPPPAEDEESLAEDEGIAEEW